MKLNKTEYLSLEVLIIENDRILSIPYAEILTIVCDKPYIILKTTTNKYQLSQNLSTFCTELPTFIVQCNKSTYINLLHVSCIRKKNSGFEACIQCFYYPISRRRIVGIKKSFLNVKTSKYANSSNEVNEKN